MLLPRMNFHPKKSNAQDKKLFYWFFFSDRVKTTIMDFSCFYSYMRNEKHCRNVNEVIKVNDSG